MKRTYELTPEMSAALAADPVDHIANWWANNATEDEKKAAAERGATPSGAFAFVESVARKAKHGGNAACLPDALAFALAAIFLRNGSDGDEFLTPDELKRQEAEEAERKAKAEKRRKEAEKKEAKRKAELTPEQKAEEERIERERQAKTEEDEAERKAVEEARAEKRAKIERAKAIAEEMKSRQLEFDFGG